MISQTAEYALRAMVCLADSSDEKLTAQVIAGRTQVPAGYLSKVMQALARAGLASSQRGLRGGFTLARSAAEITVLDVVNAVDPVRRITTCPLGRPDHGTNLCPLHRRLDRAMAETERALGASTLAELLEEANGSKPLCET